MKAFRHKQYKKHLNYNKPEKHSFVTVVGTRMWIIFLDTVPNDTPVSLFTYTTLDQSQ